MMQTLLEFPYGKGKISYDFKDENLVGHLTSSLGEYTPSLLGEEPVCEAMAHPIGSPRLSALALAKELLGCDRPSITAIPDGISVVVAD